MIRDVRRAVIARLKSDAPLIAVVPAAQIHPSTTPASPTWPFIRWDAPFSVPTGRDCMAGATVTFFVHVFAKPRLQFGAEIETAESFCERISGLAKTRLHLAALTLPNGALAKVRVRSVRTMMDGAESDAWHGVLDCSARCFKG